MFKKLIDKLKIKRQSLEKYNTKSDANKTTPIEGDKEVNITITEKDNIFKIDISDYMTINDFFDKENSSDEYYILKSLYNYVLWNGRKQMVNKGTYYVITNDNTIYNILFSDENIEIDERTKIELDEQTQKENIICERAITFNINKNEYHYFSAKHESNGNTYYTRYYSKNRMSSFGKLDLNEEEAYDEISSVVCNLENIEGIENIVDIELLKLNILEHLGQQLSPPTKCYKKS